MSYFNFLTPQDKLMAEGGGEPTPPTPLPQNDPRGKVKKNYADIESAYGEALKVLRSSPQAVDLDINGQDLSDIQAVTERASRRDNAIKLADDLRTIASRGSLNPEYGQKLFAVADKLTRAYKAQGELEEMRQPGQPLANTPAELEGRKQWFASQIQQKEDQLKTAGSLRSPQIQQEVQGLREEEGKFHQRMQEHPEYGPQDPPDFDSALVGAGSSRRDLIEKAVTYLDKIQLPYAQIHPAAFSFTLRGVLSSMDQAGDAVMAGLIKESRQQEYPELSQIPKEQMRGSGQQQPQQQEQPDRYDEEVQQQRQLKSSKLQELGNIKTFDSTWKVLLYAVFSMILGPGPAALLFTNKAKRGQLKFELQALEEDLKTSLHLRDQDRRMKETARHNAAMEDLSQRKFEHELYQDAEYLKLRRENPKGSDPVVDQLLGSYRMWKDEVDGAEKVLNSQFNFNDAEIRKARAKREKALPQLEAIRDMIIKRRQQKLGEAAGQ